MAHLLKHTLWKCIGLLGILCSLNAATVETTPNYAPYAELLEKYVTVDGVRYDAWFANQADLEGLDAFLDMMAHVDLSTLGRSEQKAFYINLYNAAMMQAVFEAYPIQSVKEIGPTEFSIFKKRFIKQGDRQLSLDAIEKDILLMDFFDPRIHFAVNCASESCPPLRAEPFNAARLELQLEEQTRIFANSDRAVDVNRKLKVNFYSSLFDWYRGDFGVDDPGVYLNRYRNSEVPLKYAFNYLPYDWSLNATQSAER